jgi:hypothetical protein
LGKEEMATFYDRTEYFTAPYPPSRDREVMNNSFRQACYEEKKEVVLHLLKAGAQIESSDKVISRVLEFSLSHVF